METVTNTRGNLLDYGDIASLLEELGGKYEREIVALKGQIEQLESDNHDYEMRIMELENQIEELKE